MARPKSNHTAIGENEITENPIEGITENPIEDAVEHESLSINKSYTAVNKAKANKKIFGASGKLIEFDSNGEAVIDIQEALHLKNIPGYEVKES